MKRESTRFAVILGVALATACSSIPQTRPADPAPFLGEWEGTWASNTSSGSGSLNTRIDPPDAKGRIWAHPTLTNAVISRFSIPTGLVNGELVLKSPTLDIVFRLHGDQLVAEYHNKRINDKGTWYLKKK